YRLVRDSAMTEAVPPLTVKGKPEPLRAWQVLDVVLGTAGSPRQLDSPLVGRTAELRTLQDAFRRIKDERSCELVTVMGPAGLGKSRLTAEFVTELGSTTRVIAGRCLP